MSNKIFQVTEVNLYIKKLLRDDYLLSNLQIEGEVSNAKVHSSGHVYFTLKDEAAAISCVLFARYAQDVEVIPQNGKKVVVSGSIGLYEKTGSYQIYVRQIHEAGQGLLYQKMELLKQKLKAEGIFDKPKKSISQAPSKIGIVTSETGAAIQDILQISVRRNPGVQLILYPSLVQGERAALNIAKGIAYFNQQKDKVDTIIIGRGGGSIEDLWPFNEEVVVRAVFHSDIPVISAVGHESDVALSDLVADLRAPTPSAAAELAIPEQKNLAKLIEETRKRLYHEFQIYVYQYKSQIENLQYQIGKYHPRRKLDDISMQLVSREKELNREFAHYLKKIRWQLELQQKELISLNPKLKLNAGYVYLESTKGVPIQQVKDVNTGDYLKAYLKDGSLNLKVEGIINATKKNK